MTIEQAIKHSEEVACRKCDECGKEHRQLAEWLKELISARRRLKIADIALELIYKFVDNKRGVDVTILVKTVISNALIEIRGEGDGDA